MFKILAQLALIFYFFNDLLSYNFIYILNRLSDFSNKLRLVCVINVNL